MKALLFCLVICACGDDGGAGGADGAPGADAGPPQFGRATSFLDVVVSGVEPSQATSVETTLLLSPGTDPYTIDASEGACRRLVTAPAFCDPPCISGSCVADDLCEPFPVPASAGVVTVSGASETITIDPPAIVVQRVGAVFSAG